ncbi:uncharacterized protein TNCV_2455441 [Trichonephila clavipes]|nr:uncharacterized protein TNCV_2455441 [Trichonephila clavipes]
MTEKLTGKFSIISEANGWTEGVKACQLAASLRGEAAEILHTLTDTEQLNLNSLHNALGLRFGQKYSKDYAHLQMKIRLQKTEESLQEYASEPEGEGSPEGCKNGRCPRSSICPVICPEIGGQASRRDCQSIQGPRVTLDAPCESPWKSDIEKLRDEFKAFKVQRQNQEKRNLSAGDAVELDTREETVPDQGRMKTSPLLPNRKAPIQNSSYYGSKWW